ncbi:MAG: right-handed parallel beta-helix repeat-containing protein [Gammaproteobacteria bacterium]|nr:right-handed parallel beta-helix repeat-containing protein [Gammaproteobacteria bacterium]
MSRKKVGLSLTLLFVALSAKADPTIWRPESGRVQLSAAQSNIGIFGTDGMLPLFGNNHQFVYSDLMADYGTDETYFVSPGLGYRTVVHNQMLGGYVFADYERTSLGENFWVISPGVEWTDTHWDAHVNGYFPTQSEQQTGNTDWADNFGNYDSVDLVEGTHIQNDATVVPYAVVANGVDTEVGYSFAQENNLRSRVYVGGYYYQPHASYDVSNITGGTAGFTKSLTKNFSGSVFNSYDNVNHYTLGISLTFTIGGESNQFSTDITDRLLDPVERHVGIIRTGAGTYDQQSLQQVGYGQEFDDVYEVSPDGTGDGTIGNPASLDQATLDNINSESPYGAHIYMQGGEEAVYTVSDSSLTLYQSQNIFGRTEDYKAPADSDSQPEIDVDSVAGNSGFIINDTTNMISDITINGNGSSTSSPGPAGISVFGNSTVTISNVNVSGFANGYGVYAINSNDEDTLILDIANSTFSNNGGGVLAENDADGSMIVTISNSAANNEGNNGLSVTNNLNGGTSGKTTVNMSDSEFNNSLNAGVYVANGVNGTLIVTVSNSIMSGSQQVGMEIDNSTTGTGSGAGTLTANIRNSTFDSNGTPNAGPGLTISSSGQGTLTVAITDSTISNNDQFGIYVGNNSSLANSVIDISDLSGTTFSNNGFCGIYGSAFSGSTTTIDYTDAVFSGNTPTNQSGGDNIHWIPGAA